MSEQENSASTEQVTPEAPAAEIGSAAPAPAAEITPPAEGEITPPPAYNPNFKFKVLDKELEIDPLFRGLIKDADTEKKIRELHEKAYGLDSVKSDRQALKQKIESHYEPVAQQLSAVSKSVQQIDRMIEKQDFDNFFGVLQINEQDVLKWAVKKAQLMELTPDQQQEYTRQVQERNRLYSLEQQVADNQEASFSYQVQARTTQLEQELSKPEVLNMVDTFDAKAGKPGAFRAEVINRGKFHAFQGNDISVEEAVKEVLTQYSPFLGNTNQAPQQVQQPANNSVGNGGQAQQAQNPPSKPAVIPNVAGQGTSPGKKIVRSLDDLRQRAREFQEQ